MRMREGTSIETSLSSEGETLRKVQAIKGSRVSRAGLLWGRRAAHALVDALIVFLPTTIGATVGFVPGAFFGGWVGSEILKRKEGLSAKQASEKIRNRKFAESAKLFGQKTARALTDAIIATFPVMLGTLIGNALIPGAGTLGGALIGSWISAQMLKRIHRKRATA